MRGRGLARREDGGGNTRRGRRRDRGAAERRSSGLGAGGRPGSRGVFHAKHTYARQHEGLSRLAGGPRAARRPDRGRGGEAADVSRETPRPPLACGARRSRSTGGALRAAGPQGGGEAGEAPGQRSRAGLLRRRSLGIRRLGTTPLRRRGPHGAPRRRRTRLPAQREERERKERAGCRNGEADGKAAFRLVTHQPHAAGVCEHRRTEIS